MNYKNIKENHVLIRYSEFLPKGKNGEIHALFLIEKNDMNFEQQFALLDNALQNFTVQHSTIAKPVMARYFCSDIANQEAFILNHSSLQCPYSVLGQSPLDGSKLALWVWFSGEKGNYRYLRTSNNTSTEAGGYLQTIDLLETYEENLEAMNMKIADNCVRTWFFVQDVDTNYPQVVKGRKENFIRQNLTKDTHFIASTGIEAKSGGKALVKMDALAISPLQPEQIRYLYAPTHLNPTYEYGVTFERGSVVEFGDRKHVFISGTASINNKGEVLYSGNVENQTQRMWENVETLLKEGESSYNDVNYIIVYLRDIADTTRVDHLFEERFPHIPRVLVLAPVCRPTWLIEMECMATIPASNKRFADL